ncbi:biotin transporter BioY [Streptococcus thermophilus]|uniref:biotin transporter BioY n=1 Tax=Streptococcus thermophilus TaxID=1308 RepID=UPI00288ADDD7|nr:biotin transporter BioY [Streptococcus thermophilus]
MNKTCSIILIALGAALIVALSPFQIALGPISYHTSNIGNRLNCYTYRPKEATLSVLLYLLLGAIDLPVFSGGNDGLHTFIGQTGGFLLFFPLRALITSLIANRKKSLIQIFIANFLGEVVIFIGGAIGFIIFTHSLILTTLKLVVLPFVLPDFIKITLTTLFSLLLLKALQSQSYFKI